MSFPDLIGHSGVKDEEMKAPERELIWLRLPWLIAAGTGTRLDSFPLDMR